MKRILVFAMLACSSTQAVSAVLYQQPPSLVGGAFVSSWWDPDGSNYDQYVWDAFTLDATANVNAVEWRGTYGASGPATNFTVAIYGSIPAGTQPDFSRPPLVEYQTGDNAGQTFAGIFGGVAMYDHSFTLPVVFEALAGVKYWLQIEGWQPGFPDWSLAAGSGGDGSHFLCEHNNITSDGGTANSGGADRAGGVPTGCWFTSRTGDGAFTLLGTGTVGVDDPASGAEFALGRISPNPSRGDQLNVRFSLPDAAPARIALFDLLGRCAAAFEVGEWGAGQHSVNLARRGPIPPGIYVVRLTRGGQHVTRRVAIIP